MVLTKKGQVKPSEVSKKYKEEFLLTNEPKPRTRKAKAQFLREFFIHEAKGKMVH